VSRRRSALAALVVVVGLAGSALAQTETRRAPANDPSTILGNALFTLARASSGVK